MDVARGRIVQAHDLVLAHVERRLAASWASTAARAPCCAASSRGAARPDLRRHAILDWKDVQPFVGHVPTAKLLMPLQRLRRLHPAQIADLVEGASHEEGEEIIQAVQGDAELTADVFEELDTEHQARVPQDSLERRGRAGCSTGWRPTTRPTCSASSTRSGDCRCSNLMSRDPAAQAAQAAPVPPDHRRRNDEPRLRVGGARHDGRRGARSACASTTRRRTSC